MFVFCILLSIKKDMQPLLEQKLNRCRIPHCSRWYMIFIQRFLLNFFFNESWQGFRKHTVCWIKIKYHRTSWDNLYLSHGSTPMTANFNVIARGISLVHFWIEWKVLIGYSLDQWLRSVVDVEIECMTNCFK